MRIDLHSHSAASDGTDSPAGLVAAAVAAGLDVLALTDHDTVDGWDEAIAAAAHTELALVPGLELTCDADGIPLHLLAYLPDPRHPALAGELSRVVEEREQRARRITDALAADLAITYDDVLAQVTGDATVGRPHIADALVARGHVADRGEAFARYLHDGSPYYRPHYAPEACAAVRLVRAAGGVPVMAHPFAAHRGRVVGDEVVEAMAEAGLAGLEAHHPEHTPDQRRHTLDLAAALGLLVTGASDYHGTGKPNRLGECTTDPETYAALLAQARSGGGAR